MCKFAEDKWHKGIIEFSSEYIILYKTFFNMANLWRIILLRANFEDIVWYILNKFSQCSRIWTSSRICWDTLPATAVSSTGCHSVLQHFFNQASATLFTMFHTVYISQCSKSCIHWEQLSQPHPLHFPLFVNPPDLPSSIWLLSHWTNHCQHLWDSVTLHALVSDGLETLFYIPSVSLLQ